MYQINFPRWEEIKCLDREVHRTCVLFDIFGSVYGRLSFFEDFQNEIIFDIMNQGVVETLFSNLMPNGYLCVECNEKEYEILKKQITEIFNSIINNMIQSAQEDKIIIGEY